MAVLAALGDVPTTAIAVVAILLGVLLLVRDKHGGEAAASADREERAPSLLTPAPAGAGPDAPADDEPAALATMAEGEIGHGPIRLGGFAQPPAAAEPAVPPAVAEPAVPPAAAEPDVPPGVGEAAVAEPVVEPRDAPEPVQPPAPAGPPASIAPPGAASAAPAPAEPAGRLPFRQGAIKLRRPRD